MKIRALFVDHDDTIVDSTQTVHYPAFLETLRTLRPQEPLIEYADFVHHCHTRGFQDLCENRYSLTAEEMAIEYDIWKKYTRSIQPKAFEGIKEVLTRFKSQGGTIIVVSHSESHEIKRDYLTQFGFEPDAIFGWELGENYRKPHPYPIHESIKRFNLQIHECLMLDDMSLGQTMAHNANILFAWAGWSHIKNDLAIDKKSSTDLFFTSIAELNDYLDC